jgi:PqqD family protein of HPr-rel-A system
MLPNPEALWSAVPGDTLAWREWGTEVFVFNGETGGTHLLNELAGEVLFRLVAAEKGATITALAAELADDTSSAEGPEWVEAIAQVLSDFERVGLARPETP